jgi:hypothetical protein
MLNWFSGRPAARPGRVSRRRSRPGLETLEDRTLLSTAAVNVAQVVRPVATQDLGVNLTWWDGALSTTQTQQMVQAAGLNLFRFPGGSSADTWHFNVGPTWNGEGTSPSMASFISALGGNGIVTLNYGTGSPQEAAAFLAYLNGSPGNTTVIGVGPQWNSTTNSWVNVNWGTAGYWAGLRAATPLAQDDGLNFLRVGRAAPFAEHYFEVGNEVYGSWETDEHATPHDPTTYVTFAKQFAALAAKIDPTISIGVDGSGTGGSYSQIPGNWTAQVLQQSAAQGFIPGFISDHNYMYDPGDENDATLLLDTATNPNANSYGGPINWAGRAAAYQSLINQYLGSAGSKVQLLATEFNSVSSDPSNQTTSLVNGLWLADALGGLLQTSYAGATFWDLRNGYATGNDNTSLYGWRTGGDYGLLGSAGTAPATGTYVPYPTYFAEELVSEMVRPGGNVVQASSSDSTMGVYAVEEANGHLDLLVINKNPNTNVTEQFTVSGFTPGGQATVYQYGEAQDTAQSETTNGASSLATSTTTLSVSGSSFSYTFPQYSMTVLDLAPSGTQAPRPTVATPAAASANPVTGKTVGLSVLGQENGTDSGLTYTWSGAGPAAVTFSANGANAAKASTATFSQAGTYTLTATISDGTQSVTSSVSVTVNQTLTSLKLSPASATVPDGGTQQFTAAALDQFGNALASQPSFTWSLGSPSVGALGSAGLYTAPASGSGSAAVTASTGGLTGSAAVTVSSTGLPSGWSDADIGAPAHAGSASYGGGTWTVSGGGADIWNGSDQFNFASSSLAGNGSIVAEVTSLTNTNAWAKAGVMLRNGGAANAAFVDVLVTPGNGVAFQWRPTAGGTPGNVQVTGVAAPAWVKLTLSGSSFTGFYSTNGTTWTQVGSTQTITMASPVEAGLAVTAHDNTQLATATFTNVAVQAGGLTQLSRNGWVASASSTEPGGSPQNALDGNLSTRWSSGADQASGQWFQVSLGSAQTFRQLVLDSTNSPNDYARSYAVYVSNNGTDWAQQSAVATGSGAGAVTTITLPAAVTASYVRVVLTGGNPSWWWSIDEFNLYG